jgi:hypothetical protein
VQSVLRQDPFGGTVFVFRSKRADRVKMLVYDGTGLVLIWKRLEGAKLKWPAISDGGDASVGSATGGAVRGPRLETGLCPADQAPTGGRLIQAASR